MAASAKVESHVQAWRVQLGLHDQRVGVGIDRIDYTKGIPEKLRAFEELLVRPGLDLGARVAGRNTSVREEFLMIQGHNSYHLGQIVVLRQLLGAWPPPHGGQSW